MIKLERDFIKENHKYIRKTRCGSRAIYSKEKLNSNGTYATPYDVEYQVIKVGVENSQRINIDGFRIDVSSEYIKSSKGFESYSAALVNYRRNL